MKVETRPRFVKALSRFKMVVLGHAVVLAVLQYVLESFSSIQLSILA